MATAILRLPLDPNTHVASSSFSSGMAFEPAPPSAERSKAFARPRRLRRAVPVSPASDLAQQHLEARFANIKPSDFGEQGVMIFAPSHFQPPQNFMVSSQQGSWRGIDSNSEQLTFTDAEQSALESKSAVLFLADYNEMEQVRGVVSIALHLDRMTARCPALISVHHSTIPGSPDPELSVFKQVLQSGIDDVVAGEPQGLMLAVAVRCRLQKLEITTNHFHAIINEWCEMQARASTLQASIKTVIWDYLRQRLDSGLPAVEPDCPRGIPSTIDGLSVGPRLGKGTTGEVFSLLMQGQGPSGEVLKCIEKEHITNITGLRSIKHQLRIMNFLSRVRPHPNIVKLYQVYHIDTHVIFRMEAGGRFNLFMRLKARQDRGWTMSSSKACSLIEQGTLAVAHLHSCDIAHRDIKPENVCVQETPADVVLKLIDFDISVQCSSTEQVSGRCGTFPFLAPEVMFQQSYSPFPADVWSLGILHSEILCGLHLLHRALGLQAQREFFEQEHAQRGRELEDRAAKKYLTQKIGDHFLREGAASHMINTWVRSELQPLAVSLNAMLDAMITMPNVMRSKMNDVLQLFQAVNFQGKAE